MILVDGGIWLWGSTWVSLKWSQICSFIQFLCWSPLTLASRLLNDREATCSGPLLHCLLCSIPSAQTQKGMKPRAPEELDHNFIAFLKHSAEVPVLCSTESGASGPLRVWEMSQGGRRGGCRSRKERLTTLHSLQVRAVNLNTSIHNSAIYFFPCLPKKNELAVYNDENSLFLWCLSPFEMGSYNCAISCKCRISVLHMMMIVFNFKQWNGLCLPLIYTWRS